MASCHWPWFRVDLVFSRFQWMGARNQPALFPDAPSIAFPLGPAGSIGPSRVIDPLNAFLVPSSKQVNRWLTLGRRDAETWLRHGAKPTPLERLLPNPAQRFIA